MKKNKIRRRSLRSSFAILRDFQPEFSRKERREVRGFSSLLAAHKSLGDIGAIIDMHRPPLANWPRYKSGIGLRLRDKKLKLMVAHRMQANRLEQIVPTLLLALNEAGYEIDELDVVLATEDGVVIEDPDVLPVKPLQADVLLANTQYVRPNPRLGAAAQVWSQWHTFTDPTTKEAMRQLALAVTPEGTTQADLKREFLTGEVQILLTHLEEHVNKKHELEQSLQDYPVLDYEALPPDHPVQRNKEKTLQKRNEILQKIESHERAVAALKGLLAQLHTWLAYSDDAFDTLPWEVIDQETRVLHPDTHPQVEEKVEPLKASQLSVETLREGAQQIVHTPLRKNMRLLADAIEAAGPVPESAATISVKDLLQEIRIRLLNPKLRDAERALLNVVLQTPMATDQDATQMQAWLYERLEEIPKNAK